MLVFFLRLHTERGRKTDRPTDRQTDRRKREKKKKEGRKEIKEGRHEREERTPVSKH